ncbi:hypothetical protein COU77_01640 [Candidatus Peregrinibacteria bacterium CG10_big_fil_rev_8_21_14_0_10_49_16]|nr:MAG: hypothetical protein COU77_01640 [Candidatus Peregrinibacteria bacterium CG10_big_fil_rev_8_21_14_0_10_49_16]
MLFSILFIALNYHSFLQLSSNYLDPLRALRHDDAFASDITDLLTRSQKPTSELDLLALLPSVGPPYNRLIIPKLNLNVPIAIPPSDALLAEDWEKLEMDIQKSLEDGVVHYPGTARPGQAGNFFVTGHSSYYPWAPGDYKSVFAKLQLLNEGDEYWVYYNGDRFRYKIFEKQEVKPSNVSVLDQPLAKRISTLMTCTPTGTTLRRLILTAQELDPETGTPMRVGERTKRDLPTIKPAALPI